MSAEDALVSADLIALMRGGTVVQSGTPAEVYLKPISADVAESTGDVVTIPAMRSSDGRYFSVLNHSDIRTTDGESGELLVRPEEIRISDNPASSQVMAKISRINYYGHDALLELEFAGMPKTVRARVAGVYELRSWPDSFCPTRRADPLGVGKGYSRVT